MEKSKVLVRVLVKPGCVSCNVSTFIVKRLNQKYDFDVKFINIKERKYHEYMVYADRLPQIFVQEEIIEGKIDTNIIKDIFHRLDVQTLKSNSTN